MFFVAVTGLDTAVVAQFQAARPSNVTPVHDAPDIPFRRAPMGPSSRSIVVSLTTNLHLAFDAHLLRTHTVWEGVPLNLYGPPFNNTATRFICDITGSPLWASLPRQPWETGRPDGGRFEVAESRFLGVSTRNGPTSFLYELLPASDAPAQVQEMPRCERVQSRDAVIRRVRISPHREPVRWSPFHGPGESVLLPDLQNAIAIRRARDFLLVTARGLPSRALAARRDDADHVVLLQSERGGKGPYSAVVTNLVSGPQVQITLTLPPSAVEQVVEVATAVCADRDEALALAKELAAAPDSFGEGGASVLTSRWPSANGSARASPHRPPPLAYPSNVRDGVVRVSGADESFVIEHLPVPKDIKLLVGGMDFLPNGDLAICTYAGEVWIVEGATGAPGQARWRRFARGLNEPGGLRVVQGNIYVTQKCELTRLVDTDANGEADFFECISDGWGYTGNYHSYATGPALDGAGNFHVMITGHRPIYDVPFMGWCVRVSPFPGSARASRAVADASSAASHERGSLHAPTAADAPKRTGEGAGLMHAGRVRSPADSTAQYMTEGFCSGLRVPNGFGEFVVTLQAFELARRSEQIVAFRAARDHLPERHDVC